MRELTFNVQNIIDGQGIEIALAGMAIVFIVLALISLFIALLPRILVLIAKKFPEAEPTTPQSAAKKGDDAVLAAIGYALHLQQRGRP